MISTYKAFLWQIRLPRLGILSLYGLLLIYLFGASQKSLAGQLSDSLDEFVQKLDNKTQSKFISDGQPVVFEDLGLAMTPPEGWEVQARSWGMTLILQEPEDKQAHLKYDKPHYRRNITVSVQHQASPIDDYAAKQFKAEIIEKLKKSGALEVQVEDKPRFVDFKAKNDGLVYYAWFKYNGFEMAQSWLMVSGESYRIQMTYSDLNERFESDKEAFDLAWQVMSSVQLQGQGPKRYSDILIGSAIFVVFLILFILMRSMRRKRQISLWESTLNTDSDSDSDSWFEEIEHDISETENENEDDWFLEDPEFVDPGRAHR